MQDKGRLNMVDEDDEDDHIKQRNGTDKDENDAYDEERDDY